VHDTSCGSVNRLMQVRSWLVIIAKFGLSGVDILVVKTGIHLNFIQWLKVFTK